MIVGLRDYHGQVYDKIKLSEKIVHYGYFLTYLVWAISVEDVKDQEEQENK